MSVCIGVCVYVCVVVWTYHNSHFPSTLSFYGCAAAAPPYAAPDVMPLGL